MMTAQHFIPCYGTKARKCQPIGINHVGCRTRESVRSGCRECIPMSAADMPIDRRTALARHTLLKTNEPAFRCSRAAAENRKNWPQKYDSPTDRVESAASTTRLLRAPSAEETGRPEQSWPDYLEALEAIKGAAQTLTAMEDHSQKIQAKAFELTQHAKTDRLEASHQIASLQQQLATSEARIVELDSLLAAAELRAQIGLHADVHELVERPMDEVDERQNCAVAE